jgi:hypothetical protein
MYMCVCKCAEAKLAVTHLVANSEVLRVHVSGLGPINKTVTNFDIIPIRDRGMKGRISNCP